MKIKNWKITFKAFQELLKFGAEVANLHIPTVLNIIAFC